LSKDHKKMNLRKDEGLGLTLIDTNWLKNCRSNRPARRVLELSVSYQESICHQLVEAYGVNNQLTLISSNGAMMTVNDPENLKVDEETTQKATTERIS